MIGIVMLNTQFPRLLGDVGNANSFQEEVIYEIVDIATVSTIVISEKPDDEIIDAFVDAAKKLIKRGAMVIGTSCGFMASAQNDISNQLSAPFLSSSLILLPLIKILYGTQSHIGILSFDSKKLAPCHFPEWVQLDSDTISVTGLDSSGYWCQCIQENKTEVDIARAKQDVLRSVSNCLAKNPQTAVLLLECTNLSPWKKEIKQLSGLPVFDLVEALEWIAKSKPS